jgi:excisionase family DNA binding protein
MVDPVSIPEAARDLGLHPARVRAMAAHGQLPAEKIGSRWLIERADVERRRRQDVPAGRPLAPHNAWAMLHLASGRNVEGVNPSVRSRLKRALMLEGISKLVPRLVRRAEVQSFGAHPGEISYLLDDPALVRSGISAAGAHHLDLVSGNEADGYLSESELHNFVRSHVLSPAGVEGNVRLRIVPDHAWRFLEGDAIAPIGAVAVDLAEDSDPRSAQAGRAVLRNLDQSVKSDLKPHDPAAA